MKFYFILLLSVLITPLMAQNYNIQSRSEMSFPGETVANIFGFSKGGHEYALVGGSLSTHVVDVTNPDAPVQVASFPFVNSLWKEIRVYDNVAYISTEGGGGGLQIIDLSPLPLSTTLPTYRYKGDGVIANQLQTIHALQVDETKGFLYLYGSNIGTGGAIVCDLKTNPYIPTYAGRYDGTYIHDGYADNDTLYGAHINEGYFSIIDMSDKNNPVVLATQTTPTSFTHNTWITKDRKHLLTTDETANSYLAMYDISDITDIKEVGRFQCTPGSGSVVHNTYVKGDYAVTAWYRDGVNIVDCTRPENMIQTAWYDTYAGVGSGFDGAWGVYPYFPSGNIIVSNIDPGKIFILTPTYKRASYFEGTVKSTQTNAPIIGAKIELFAPNLIGSAHSNNQGAFKTGHRDAIQVTATCSKLGYISQTIVVQLQEGEVVNYDFKLQTAQTYVLTGTVKDEQGNPIPGAKVGLQEAEASFLGEADNNGAFTIPGILPATYQIFAGAWGYKNKGITQSIANNSTVDLVLAKGYKDDFAVDLGWIVSGTSAQGIFERAEPVGLSVQGINLRPETDIANDLGDKCFVTGNNGVDFADDDVLSGTAIITSPVMDLTGYVQPKLKFATFFISITSAGQTTSDKMKIYLSNGSTEKLLFTRASTFDSDWKTTLVAIPPTLPLTNNMTLRVEVSEAATTDFVVTEGAFDDFEVINGVSAVGEPFNAIELSVQPNPFHQYFVLQFEPITDPNSTVVVSNLLGQVVQTKGLDTGQQSIELGEMLQDGVYFVQIRSNTGVSKGIKVVKK